MKSLLGSLLPQRAGLPPKPHSFAAYFMIVAAFHMLNTDFLFMLYAAAGRRFMHAISFSSPFSAGVLPRPLQWQDSGYSAGELDEPGHMPQGRRANTAAHLSFQDTPPRSAVVDAQQHGAGISRHHRAGRRYAYRRSFRFVSTFTDDAGLCASLVGIMALGAGFYRIRVII